MIIDTASAVPATRRPLSVLIWTWCALIIVTALVSWVFFLMSSLAENTIVNTVTGATTNLAFIAFGTTGALVISRQPRNTVGWLMMLLGSLAFVWPFDIYVNNLAQPPTEPSALFLLGLWFWSWLWLWLIFPLLFILLFFPTGRLLSPRWRWVAFLGIALCLFFILFVTFGAEFGAQDGSWAVPNPIGFIPMDAFPMAVWAILLLTFVGLCVASLFVRYRRASSVEREQIKWLLYAGALFLVIYAVGFVFSDLEGLANDLWSMVLFAGILAFPVAIAIAILRYRLYDIDVIIRRTVLYAALTAILALVYFGSVTLLTSLFSSVSGQQSALAIVLSTLFIAALFNPLRRRMQDWIDRRFFRRKYDAQQVLAQFAATARDETDLDSLTRELVRVVEETLQPEAVSIWIADEKR